MGWPADVASAVKELYHGLCVARKRNMLKLAEVQQRLQALVERGHMPRLRRARLPSGSQLRRRRTRCLPSPEGMR